MASKKAKRHEPAPWWAWMLFGLSMGLAVALFIYLKAGAPDLDLAGTPRVAATAARAVVAPSGTVSPQPAARGEPAAVEPAADDSTDASEGPAPDDFGFYTSLRDAEVALPEDTTEAVDRADSGLEYEIQAGAFRDFEDADALKARLAFLGIESKITTARVGDERWHRIIIGPIGPGEANGVVRILRNQDLDFLPPRRVSN
jgi:cell division protein FtsN